MKVRLRVLVPPSLVDRWIKTEARSTVDRNRRGGRLKSKLAQSSRVSAREPAAVSSVGFEGARATTRRRLYHKTCLWLHQTVDLPLPSSTSCRARRQESRRGPERTSRVREGDASLNGRPPRRSLGEILIPDVSLDFSVFPSWGLEWERGGEWEGVSEKGHNNHHLCAWLACRRRDGFNAPWFGLVEHLRL